MKIVADNSITIGSNFVVGANKPDMHLKNVNYPRDFNVDIIADIATARPGDICTKCNGELLAQQGIEVGHIFKLGIFLSERLGASFLDQDGISRPIIMGCYGIGVGRLLAAAVEQNHDEKGIIWPLAIAPYQIYLCALNMDNPDVAEAAERLYHDLGNANLEVLFDDREESAGVKFNDADLVGIPLRLTISPRTLKNQSVEIKWRREKQSELLPLQQELTDKIKELVSKHRKG
jgi:prolyl-tRNA synthetase